MNNQITFEILYALAANNGREASLFGYNMPLAREAFEHSMACDDFPEVWFELPLKGDPWCDLHLLTSRKSLHPGMTFSADKTGGHPGAFEWFATQDDVRQLALSWDTGKGVLETPAVQLLMLRRNHTVSSSFLHAAGRDDLEEAYRSFVERIPGDWFACYSGVFPNRKHDFVRVECVLDTQLQREYAQDATLLEAHLRQAGIQEFGKTVVSYCQELARTPFRLEFQFDVLPDGTTGQTFGASVRFACPPNEGDWLSFDVDGAAGELMQRIESSGLADARWRQLAGTMFAKRLQRNGESRVLSCYPAFVKLRWRGGEPLDAKTYLLAEVSNN